MVAHPDSSTVVLSKAATKFALIHKNDACTLSISTCSPKVTISSS